MVGEKKTGLYFVLETIYFHFNSIRFVGQFIVLFNFYTEFFQNNFDSFGYK